MRRVLLALGAAGLVLACGVTGFLLAGPTDAPGDPGASLPSPPAADPRTTYTVDGVARGCLSSGAFTLRAEVADATDATFVVDGAEIASYRGVGLARDGSGGVVPSVRALVPRTMRLRCDDGGTHRIDVYTDRPRGCRLSVFGEATFAEARSHATEASDVDLPDGVCSLTVHD